MTGGYKPKIPVPPRADLQAQCEAGLNTTEIAESHGVSRRTIRIWLVDYGLEASTHRRRDIDDAMQIKYADIRDLLALGKTYAEIARELACGYRTILKVKHMPAPARPIVRPAFVAQRSRPSAYALECAWAFGIASGQGHQPSLNLEAA